MADSWLPMIGSERLHNVNATSWHDAVAPRAARLATSPVPFLSVFDDEPSIHVSVIDGSSHGEVAEFSVRDAAELPPEIAELLFGAQAS